MVCERLLLYRRQSPGFQTEIAQTDIYSPYPKLETLLYAGYYCMIQVNSGHTSALKSFLPDLQTKKR